MDRWNTFQSSQKPVEEKLRAAFKVNRFKRTLPGSLVRSGSNEQVLEEIHKEFVNSAVSKISNSIANVCESVKLEKLMNDLDKLVAESKDLESKAWRPSSSAADNLAAHNFSLLKNFEEKLESNVLASLKSERSALSARFNQLMTTIASNSEEMKVIQQRIVEDSSESKENVAFEILEKS